MVIATTQVNTTIKKARGEAYYESVQQIRKAAKTICTLHNKINYRLLYEQITIDNKNITTGFSTSFEVVVQVKEGGKFENMILPDNIDTNIYKRMTLITSSGKRIPYLLFKPDCDVVD